MQSIKDLVGQNIAVRTETAEDFDLVSETLGYEWKTVNPWYVNESDTCISLLAKKFGTEKAFTKKGFEIYDKEDFSEFSDDTFNIDADDDIILDDDLELEDTSSKTDLDKGEDVKKDEPKSSSVQVSEDSEGISIFISNSALEVLIREGIIK